MKRIALSLLILSSSIAYGFDFFQYSPQNKVINGENYPRNSYIRYRGTTKKQMSLNKALRAMFQNEDAYLESFFFSKIKLELMKQSVPFSYNLSRYLQRKIDNKIKSNGGALNPVDATNYAKHLVDDHFKYHTSKDRNWAIDSYINYNSSTFNDWPQEVVFSSIVSPSAGTYGDRIVVIDEKTPRSLDLNFWNKVHNDKWFDHTRDAGEFLAPGYIPYSDIIGYEIRSGSSKRWWDIEYIFYLEYINGQPVILVFDGEGRNCAMKTESNDYVFCKFRGRDSFADGPRPPSKYKLPLMGVISSNSIDKTSIKNRFKVLSSRDLPDWIDSEIKSLNKTYYKID